MRYPVRANTMLDEIGQLAGKPETGDHEKLSILLEMAGVYAGFDHIRAFETLREIVKKANKLEVQSLKNGVPRLRAMIALSFKAIDPDGKPAEITFNGAQRSLIYVFSPPLYLSRVQSGEHPGNLAGVRARDGRLGALRHDEREHRRKDVIQHRIRPRRDRR